MSSNSMLTHLASQEELDSIGDPIVALTILGRLIDEKKVGGLSAFGEQLGQNQPASRYYGSERSANKIGRKRLKSLIRDYDQNQTAGLLLSCLAEIGMLEPMMLSFLRATTEGVRPLETINKPRISSATTDNKSKEEVLQSLLLNRPK